MIISNLSTFIVCAILFILLWAALLLIFFRVIKRTKQTRPVSTSFTFFNPIRENSNKLHNGTIPVSKLDDLAIKILTYSNISVKNTLPIQIYSNNAHSEFAVDDTDSQFSIFSDEEIESSVSHAQQNLSDIIAKRSERKAELYEFEQLLDALDETD